MATLDKSKPFGTIFNDDAGRVYEQGGRFFRGDGTLWTDAADTAAAAKPQPAKGKPKADPAPADDQLAAQLGNT